MTTWEPRHGYCDTCHHIRAVHGPTCDPRHEPCECCEPTTKENPMTGPVPDVTFDNPVTVQGETR